MTERERVIKELQGLNGSKETMKLISDAIELLKEQSEADEVAPTISEGAEGEEVIYCGSCGTSLYHLYPWKKINKAREFVQYCRHCGQKVKWE